MLATEKNEILTRTGRETPLGEMLRRYWLPVGDSSEVTPGGRPTQVKVMGEDLVLFRDDKGQVGLLGMNCSHRLTSLAYGRVEDGGIRCPFHGWLYDVGGKCLEQPAEPVPFTDKFRHLAYLCQELGGLIFTYMGPKEKMPLLPRYEVLARENGTRKVDYYKVSSNFLQHLEGALDTAHFPYLHSDNWSRVKHRRASMPKPQIEVVETDYGIAQKSTAPRFAAASMETTYSSFFMPTGFMRLQEGSSKGEDTKKFQSWFVPIDDTHTIRFVVGFAPLGKDGKPYEWPSKRTEGDLKAFIQPGVENDYFRNYEEVDTISGIPCKAGGTEAKGFMAQDNMVNELQGPIVDRSQEHLGSVDKVLTAMRVMYLLAIENVRKGQDPKHIIREQSKNEICYI